MYAATAQATAVAQLNRSPAWQRLACLALRLMAPAFQHWRSTAGRLHRQREQPACTLAASQSTAPSGSVARRTLVVWSAASCCCCCGYLKLKV
jgi:hypothetical protein